MSDDDVFTAGRMIRLLSNVDEDTALYLAADDGGLEPVGWWRWEVHEDDTYVAFGY